MPKKTAGKPSREVQQELEAGPSIPLYEQTDTGIGSFRQMVLDHYRNHGRPMPWRETTDPYCILVSEIMLQQTQVGRVMTKYGEFLAAFPDFSTLAQAPLPEILAVWQGMGYNRRAISLRKCAETVIREHGGMLPADPELLATFPGIGKATAASICAFAFNLPVVFIETNIRRVFIHYFFPGHATVSDAEILPLVERSLPRDNSRIWYWALMDLGTALKTTAGNPNRRSVHYTKQAPFAGSDRRIRGMILRQILPGNEVTIEEIIATSREDPARIRKILCDLERDGFISRRDENIRLAG